MKFKFYEEQYKIKKSLIEIYEMWWTQFNKKYRSWIKIRPYSNLRCRGKWCCQPLPFLSVISFPLRYRQSIFLLFKAFPISSFQVFDSLPISRISSISQPFTLTDLLLVSPKPIRHVSFHEIFRFVYDIVNPNVARR